MNSFNTEHYHFIGIAGVGMSALAELLVKRGAVVTGSDRHLDQGRDLEVLRKLHAMGVGLVPQDGVAISHDMSAVITSTAIEDDNPDRCAALKLGVPVIHRAELLAGIVSSGRCIAIAGTSGKTTVTGMVGWILEQVAADPTVVNGGVVIGWDTSDSLGNTRVGDSGLIVIEADESDRSLLRFTPEFSVITNISHDHFAVPEAVELFRQFSGNVKSPVVCPQSVADLIGLDSEHAITDIPIPEWSEHGWFFVYRDVTFNVPLPGRHNAENAALAIVLCAQLGIDLHEAKQALSEFRGIRRRLEYVGAFNGAKVIDEYAHNPAKIAAAWTAMSESAERVLGVWRPHGYRPLAMMQEELVEALAKTMRKEDGFFVLPVYYVGGTAEQKVSSEEFVELMRALGLTTEFAPDYDWLRNRLLQQAKPGDCVLCMGARDPELSVFARNLIR